MKVLLEKYNNLFFNLFLISIFFFRIPNFYLITFYKNDLLTSQALSRFGLILVFIFNIVDHFVKRRKIILKNKKNSLLLLLIIIFFVLQSLSIFSAINIYSFLIRYKDILIGFISFFVFFFYRKSYLKIIQILFITTCLNLLYQFFMIFGKQTFISVMNNIIYEKHWKLVLLKLSENRINIDVYDEIIIPFLFFSLSKSFFKKTLSYFMFILITFFSFVSNVRTRILIYIFSFISSLILFWQSKLNAVKSALLILGLLCIIFISNMLSLSYSGFSFYDRFILSDETEDVRTITNRFSQIEDSFYMGFSSIFGIGLGNYFDNLSPEKNIYKNRSNYKDVWHIGGIEYVHNIFGTIIAESGYFSLVIFIFILFLFLKNDFNIIKKRFGLIVWGHLSILAKKVLILTAWNIRFP